MDTQCPVIIIVDEFSHKEKSHEHRSEGLGESITKGDI